MLSEFPMCSLDRRLTPISYPRSCLLRCVILSNTLLWIHAGFEVLWAIFHAWVCHEFCAPMISDAQMSQLGSWPYGLNIRTHSWSNHPAWYVTHGSGESPHDHPTKKTVFQPRFMGLVPRLYAALFNSSVHALLWFVLAREGSPVFDHTLSFLSVLLFFI